MTSSTVAWVPSTRLAQRWLNSCRLVVMRVPPDQSATARTTWATARSGSRLLSSRVVRVSLVPKTKLSTLASAWPSAWAKCSSMRE